jgi:DNA-binding transcriptional regulator LsrR (DeoR family)
MSERLTTELTELLGETAFLALAEAFGGRRLYVPTDIPADHKIAKAIGTGAAALLAKRKSPDMFCVPLARDLRARHYRAGGMSNGEIATRLGITEKGVERLFHRMDAPPVKGSAAQLSLFSED